MLFIKPMFPSTSLMALFIEYFSFKHSYISQLYFTRYSNSSQR